jgi:hypothetical protein
MTFFCTGRVGIIEWPRAIEPRQPARLSIFGDLGYLVSREGLEPSTS